ncbi:MAG TPA: hypothetical protein VGX48_08370 [Pyrinomonadaceae bacterium]|jgi:hypothetical protein|nr:hypothetical protein [Pyrinomonadaceae bacterium]
MTPTERRELAAKIAPEDSDRALAVARGISDPWFACQALAHVARFSPENKFKRIIEESLRMSYSADDPFKTVASAAWPIRAIVERNRSEMLDSIIPELLTRAEQIELLASRSEALFLLFQAIFPAGRERWLIVFQGLLKASSPLINWRQRRNLRDAVLMLRKEEAGLASEIIGALEDAKLKRQIESRMMRPDVRLPRAFFWRRAA